jgi:hypothetical protein
LLNQQQADTAALQAELANVRLQHDLYDRRYKLYEFTKVFVLRISSNSEIDSDSIFQFTRDIGDAVFLLDATTAAYLEEIRKKAIRLQFVATIMDLPAYAEKREALVEEEGQIIMWFIDQFEVLVERFKPALALDQRNFTPPTSR